MHTYYFYDDGEDLVQFIKELRESWGKDPEHVSSCTLTKERKSS